MNEKRGSIGLKSPKPKPGGRVSPYIYNQGVGSLRPDPLEN